MKPDIYKEEGYGLKGAVFEVYNDRGYGMAGEVYQECLEIELEERRSGYRGNQELVCHYKVPELKKRYVPELFICGSLVVELKAVTQLASQHEAQLINYPRINREPVGYRIHFGHKDTLEWKRVIFSEFIRPAVISAN